MRNPRIMREQIIYAFVDLKGSEQIGEAIRKFRRQRNLTQQQLADKSDCSIMYVSNLERGKTTAELGIALRILDALDVELTLTDRRKEEGGR